MKRLGLLSVYEWGLLVVMLGVVLHAPFSVAVQTYVPEYGVPAKAWKEIVLVALGALAVIMVTKRGMWRACLSDRFIQLAGAFLLIHVILAVAFGGDVQSVAAGLLIDLRFVGMTVLTYLLVLLRPGVTRRLFAAAAAGATIIVGFGLLQITLLPDDTLAVLGYSKETITPYTTIDSNPDYVRINSTVRGPNPLGALAVVYVALGVAYLFLGGTRGSVRKKVVAATSVVGSIAVLFASYSRSAYLAFAAAMAAMILSTVRVSRRLITAGFIGVALVAAVLVPLSSTDWFSNVVLHEDPESTVMTKSNDAHLGSFVDGFERMVRQPLGAGVGSTGSASLYDDSSSNDTIIENHYFFVAHESGWIGMVVFIGLFGLVMVRLWRRQSDWHALGLFASGIGLAIIGLLLPVWADETVALTWWGLAGAVIAPISGIIKGNHATRTR